MKITNQLNLPIGLVKAVSTERHNADRCISATTLLQGVKHIILTDRHWEELEDDVSDRVWAIWGQAVHSLLEQEGENDFTEQEMSYPVGDITVTGRIDNYDMQNGIICDYKTASIKKWAELAEEKKKGFDQPQVIHEQWHIDFSYIKINGVFYYFISVLDGYSRMILGWDLCQNMDGLNAEILVSRRPSRALSATTAANLFQKIFVI